MSRVLPGPWPSHDFEELLWENGTLVMRGRSDPDNKNNNNNIVSSSALDINYPNNMNLVGIGAMKVDKKPSLEDVNRMDMEVVKEAPSRSRAGGGDFLVPDEHSQAIGSNFIDDHVIRSDTFNDDFQVPGSDSSIDTLNPPRFKVARRTPDESESTYLDEDEDEEMEDHKRMTPIHHAGGSTGTKRSRSTNHNLSEKKRRDRINKRMRALQELLPNCNKVDKASVLDEAIEYMKTLQLQLQIMSTGNHLFASSMAMLPTGGMPIPYLNQFSPMNTGIGMGMGMGMRMGPSFPHGQAHQFPTGLAGGFQQALGCMPYIPVLGGHPAMRQFMNGYDFSRATSSVIERLSSGSDKSKGSSETRTD